MCGRGFLLAALLWLLWGVGSGALVDLLQRNPSLATKPAVAGAAALAWIVGSGALLRFWRSQHPRRLNWDGASWFLARPADRAGERVDLSIGMDAQRAVLLRCSHQSGRRISWLWVERGRDAGQWHLLRCAIYCSGASIPGPGALAE